MALGVASCNSDDDGSAGNPVSGKIFVFPVVSSQEECDAAMSIGVNCEQSVEFENNRATLIVTDIINSGRYTIVDNTITITLDGLGDAENPFIFRASKDFMELERTSDGSNDKWKLQIEGILPWNL